MAIKNERTLAMKTLKIGELIEYLKQFPNDIEVWYEHSEYCNYHPYKDISEKKMIRVYKYFNNVFLEDEWAMAYLNEEGNYEYPEGEPLEIKDVFLI